MRGPDVPSANQERADCHAPSTTPSEKKTPRRGSGTIEAPDVSQSAADAEADNDHSTPSRDQSYSSNSQPRSASSTDFLSSADCRHPRDPTQGVFDLINRRSASPKPAADFPLQGANISCCDGDCCSGARRSASSVEPSRIASACRLPPACQAATSCTGRVGHLEQTMCSTNCNIDHLDRGGRQVGSPTATFGRHIGDETFCTAPLVATISNPPSGTSGPQSIPSDPSDARRSGSTGGEMMPPAEAGEGDGIGGCEGIECSTTSQNWCTLAHRQLQPIDRSADAQRRPFAALSQRESSASFTVVYQPYEDLWVEFNSSAITNGTSIPSAEAQNPRTSAMLRNLKIDDAIAQRINHSFKFQDDAYEYRYVDLSRSHPFTASLDTVQSPRNRLLSEEEWRLLGIRQTRGWSHCGYCQFEPSVLLFRRPLGTDPMTGAVAASSAARLRIRKKFGLRARRMLRRRRRRRRAMRDPASRILATNALVGVSAFASVRGMSPTSSTETRGSVLREVGSAVQAPNST